MSEDDVKYENLSPEERLISYLLAEHVQRLEWEELAIPANLENMAKVLGTTTDHAQEIVTKMRCMQILGIQPLREYQPAVNLPVQETDKLSLIR